MRKLAMFMSCDPTVEHNTKGRPTYVAIRNSQNNYHVSGVYYTGSMPRHMNATVYPIEEARMMFRFIKLSP